MTRDDQPSRLYVHIETIGTGPTHAGGVVWVHLRGEADRSNHHELESALGNIELEGTGSVHIDLSELAFCDVQACRALLVFAEDAHKNGHPVSTHRASAAIRTMAHLLDPGHRVTFA